jgi:hypothetical protein
LENLFGKRRLDTFRSRVSNHQFGDVGWESYLPKMHGADKPAKNDWVGTIGRYQSGLDSRMGGECVVGLVEHPRFDHVSVHILE